MLEIDILEGGRGTGKSTLAFKLRQKTSPTPTLINFTGFHDDGEEGLRKVTEYYEAWIRMLFGLASHNSQFVFDRFYFSEGVYSILYKEYDFQHKYYEFCELLEDLSNMGVKINVFFLTIDNEDELKQRLIRDKVPFGKAEESVEETLRQQRYYKALFDTFKWKFGNENLKVHTIDTSSKTNDEVYDEIVKLKTV
jgi:deoxyguanosine kinase